LRYVHGFDKRRKTKFDLNIPAAVTVDTGSLSRDARKDIRKGTRLIWFIALRALLDVSLDFLKTLKAYTEGRRRTTDTKEWL
jgi:hypothetical protein